MENAVSWLFAGRKGMSWKFCQKSNFTNHPPSLQLFGIMQAVSFETVNDKHTVLTQTHDCSGEVCRGIAIVLNQIKINEMSENYTVFLYFYTHTHLTLAFFPHSLSSWVQLDSIHCSVILTGPLTLEQVWTRSGTQRSPTWPDSAVFSPRSLMKKCVSKRRSSKSCSHKLHRA